MLIVSSKGSLASLVRDTFATGGRGNTLGSSETCLLRESSILASCFLANALFPGESSHFAILNYLLDCKWSRNAPAMLSIFLKKPLISSASSSLLVEAVDCEAVATLSKIAWNILAFSFSSAAAITAFFLPIGRALLFFFGLCAKAGKLVFVF